MFRKILKEKIICQILLKEKPSQSWPPRVLNNPNSSSRNRRWKMQARERKSCLRGTTRSKAGVRSKGLDKKAWGKEFPFYVNLKSADASKYDALMFPGGFMNPDQLRMNPDAV